MTKAEIDVLIASLEDIDNFEFWSCSPTDLGVYFRKYSKSVGVPILVDHRFLHKLLEGYDKDGVDCEMIQENPDLLEFVDAFFQKLHDSKFEIHLKLDKAQSMPQITSKLQSLQNHWHHKKTWNSTLPTTPVAQLTVNAIRLELPQLSGVQLITTEQDALALDKQIAEKYAQYIELESIPGRSQENS